MNNNPLTLPKVFWRDEKYTDVLWITTPEGGGHEVWIEVEGTRWLFSSIMPMNYPAVDVSVVEISRDELAAKLHHNCVAGRRRRTAAFSPRFFGWTRRAPSCPSSKSKR